MNQRSFEFHKPDFKPIIFVASIIVLSIIILEVCLHIPGLVSHFPAPSPSLSYPFPEMGLKFQRYFSAGKVNCLFFGSSMVDQAFDPEIIEDLLNQRNGPEIKCMNFGLSGAMTESSSKVYKVLLDWQPTDLVVFGLSPIEFNEEVRDSREMTNVPVFRDAGNTSLEGRFLRTFRLPWFYYGLLNRKDREFIRTQKVFDYCLTPQGLCVSNRKSQDIRDQEQFLLHDFHINQVDLDALNEVISLSEERGIKLIFVEMPIKPSYFPVVVEGGATMYERRFVDPIQEILQKHGLSLLRTQFESSEILDETHWLNENHLNYEGAKLFSSFLANQILETEDW